MKSDEQRLLEYLKENRRITRAECWEKLGCFNLPARIYDLKAKGHLIYTEWGRNETKRWAIYVYSDPVEATGDVTNA